MITAQDIIAIMKENDIRVDLDNFSTGDSLQQQGVDSLDMMTLFMELEQQLQVKIPDQDIAQGKFATIDAIVAYINDPK